jgi:hypothetical protein
MTTPINYKIDEIINILYKYEDHLSDGFGYYCQPKFSSSEEMLKTIAKDILAINKSVDETKTIDEKKWFNMAYYGNGKPKDIEEYLHNINKPLHNKIFNKKWHPKTALEIAVYNGNYKYVRDLIKGGATVTLKAIKLCERFVHKHIFEVMHQELTYNIDYAVYEAYYTKKCWATAKDVYGLYIVENLRDHLKELKTCRQQYKNGEYEVSFALFADAMKKIQ